LRLLLDTHIFLWSLTDDRALSKKGWALLQNPENSLLVSAVSIWEIAIKFGQRRSRADDMPISGEAAMVEIQRAGFELLAISGHHAAAVDQLSPVHRDPFDRLLLAQAMHEGLTLLTHDQALSAYGDCVMVV
jgi:PIN domain nuclease of toxin-antitoxin system